MNTKFYPLPLISLSLLVAGLSTACGEPPPGPEPGTGGGTGTGGGVGSGGGVGTGGGTGSATGSGGGGAVVSSTCGSADAPFSVVADEATNMTLTSTLTLNAPQVIKGGNMDTVFDWSGVVTDFYGHAIDPMKINMVAIVAWDATAEEIAQLINVDDPTLKSRVVLPAQFNPLSTGTPVTSATLREFVDPGLSPLNEADVLEVLSPERGYTFTMIIQEDVDTFGIDARMIQAFTVDNSVETTTVTMSDTSTTLTVNAAFNSAVQVPAATAGIEVEWASSIDTRSFGGEFLDNGISEVIVGQYEPGIDLAAGILDIELDYKNLYRGQVIVGSTFDLSGLKNEAGEAFPGIDGTDQWLLGLLCTTDSCTNPTPWYLTSLQTCP